MPSRRGFTLVEVLVAVALFALFSMGAFVAFNAANGSFAAAHARLPPALTASQAHALMRRALAGATCVLSPAAPGSSSGELSGRTVLNCGGADITGNGSPRFFKFCRGTNAGRGTLVYSEGAGTTPPAGCTGIEISSSQSDIVSVLFLRDAATANTVVVSLGIAAWPASTAAPAKGWTTDGASSTQSWRLSWAAPWDEAAP